MPRIFAQTKAHRIFQPFSIKKWHCKRHTTIKRTKYKVGMTRCKVLFLVKVHCVAQTLSSCKITELTYGKLLKCREPAAMMKGHTILCPLWHWLHYDRMCERFLTLLGFSEKPAFCNSIFSRTGQRMQEEKLILQQVDCADLGEGSDKYPCYLVWFVGRV